jgi:hypothetical protein
MVVGRMGVKGKRLDTGVVRLAAVLGRGVLGVLRDAVLEVWEREGVTGEWSGLSMSIPPSSSTMVWTFCGAATMAAPFSTTESRRGSPNI